jgi:DNA topoisomerase IA
MPATQNCQRMQFHKIGHAAVEQAIEQIAGRASGNQRERPPA